MSELIYPPSYDTDYVKSTSRATSNFEPWFAVDPSLSLTGAASDAQWQSGSTQITNQKFNVAFSTAFVLTELTIENAHSSGGFTNVGVDNVIVYGTNSSTAFANTTYATTTDLTEIDTIEVSEHTASDVSDPESFTFPDNTTAYQYYVLRIADNHGNTSYMGIREINFTGAYPVDIDEINGGLGFGCTVTLAGGGLGLNAGLGFGSNINVLSGPVAINGGLGFGATMDAVVHASAQINSGLGFGTTFNVLRQPVIEAINAGLGFGSAVSVVSSTEVSVNSGLGFSAVFEAEVVAGVTMNAGLGFGSTIRFSGPGESDYTECELPTFDSNRWC